MSRTALIITTILVIGATAASARTFEPAPYIAEAQVDVLTRSVANRMVGRDLFGEPYATVVVGNVDVYDRFPYVEARYFQVVSDPRWNRLLMGEVDRSLSAFDGSASGFGHLVAPRGLSADGLGRLYVADTGNDRVLVFRTVTEFDNIELEPLYAIEGLSRPYDVAYSDGGTPFEAADDRLYVANTGANEVRRYDLGTTGASLTQAIGGLGSGEGRFAGPIALTVGHDNGAHNGDVYVADAHNARLVRLEDTGSALVWSRTVPHTLGPVTSLDSDHWGNVYAAAPQTGSITKFTRSLEPVAAYAGATERPRSFHVPFATVTDHRTGDVQRSGRGTGIVVEEWGNEHGLRMLNLGVELRDATPLATGEAGARVTLTDHASVTAELMDPHSGRVVARRDAGEVDAGRREIRFEAADFVAEWNEGEYVMKVRAASTYDDGITSELEVPVSLTSAGAPATPRQLALLGNAPNPFNPTTTIRFTVPAGPSRAYNLRVYDVRGRLVRELATGQVGGGLHQVVWNGRDDRGVEVGSGIYLYRLEVGGEEFTGKMVMVK